MALVNTASSSNGHRSTPRLASRSVIAASAATSLIFAAAAPAAAAPAIGSLDSGSLQQGAGEEKDQAAGNGSLDGLLPEGTGSLDAEAGGAATGSGAGESGTQANAATPPSSTPSQPSGNAYAETPRAPGTFNPEAIGELSPQTISAVGVVTSATVGSAILSLGPYGPSTGSALIGGLLPGVTYVPAAGSLGSAGSGEFATSLGVAVSERTIFQGALGIGTTILTGYFEGMAAKQDAAELTDEDIELWDGIINSVDELRAVASLPPIERGDPHVQVAVPEPCRRGFAEKEEISEDEADELCEEAMAEQEETAGDEAENGDSKGADSDDAKAEDADSDNANAAGNGGDNGEADKAGSDPAANGELGDTRSENAAPAANPAAGAHFAGADTRGGEESIAAEPKLANTGVDAGIIGIASAVLVAIGGAFVLLGRRARS
ncbi:MAG TPA: hypothetical protein K8V11_00045 [Dietzia timorensis]|uniref:Gram-positive cocci surface proteins LPxTG domain-containing protein n=1 Tax=Dietzia timorensis TaxID=499555 RepID=A0A921F129_9ACTN|nr:hypothetical protein [Dietzia timorensis]HJE89385.1 hypothetical protein [Dietzia timorensis]